MQNNIVLELEPGLDNGRNSEGSFITLRDGRLLFTYTKYITDASDDHAPSVIAARLSDDGGRTWTREDRVLVERGDAQNVMSTSLLRLQSGRIILQYSRKEKSSRGILRCTPWLRWSDDELKTLSEPLRLTPNEGYNVVNNDRMVQLSSGRLVLPVGNHRMRLPAGEQSANPSGPIVKHSAASLIHYLLSDDGGDNWYESKTNYYCCFPDGTGLQEPGVIELKDGRLWSWSRTGWKGGERCGHQWQSFSDDGGHGWSTPEPSQFVSPLSPLSMKRIPDTGDLLAVWNDHSGRFPTPYYEQQHTFTAGQQWGARRTPLVCAISRDEGETWQHHQFLDDEPDHGYCYTAIHFVDDAVLLAYCAGNARTSIVLDRTRIRRIPTKELYSAA